MIRKHMFAGQFYPADKGELIEQVHNFVTGLSRKDVKIAICPHAGYTYSGRIAGKVLGQIGAKKTFVILGVNHSGQGSRISLSLSDFSTPLGIVKNNNILGKQIIDKLRILGYADLDENPHIQEHSIEVLLPFLQQTHKEFEIIPILLKNMTDVACIQTAYILSKFLTDDVCIVVSSDFTHYGTQYNFTPFKFNIKENIRNLDMGIIDSILRLDTKSVYDKSSKSTVCGVYGITIATELAKMLKLSGKLVDYQNSGDMNGDYENCVGYAGLIFS